MYGILAAKLSNQPEDDPFGFQSHVILLPWVSKWNTGSLSEGKVAC